MEDLVTFVARVGRSHWALLRQSFEGWSLLMPGRHPLYKKFGRVGERTAKEFAAKVTTEHLRRHGLKLELAYFSELSWRVAVRYVRA